MMPVLMATRISTLEHTTWEADTRELGTKKMTHSLHKKSKYHVWANEMMPTYLAWKILEKRNKFF